MRRDASWMMVMLLVAGTLSAQSSELAQARQIAAQGRLAEALRLVDRELERDADSAQARFVKGLILARAGRDAEAESLFLELTRSHPEYPEPFNNLAVLYAERGDYERAAEILKLALSTHSSYRTAYENLTKVYGKLASRAYDRALGQESPAPVPGPRLSLLRDLDSAGDGTPAETNRIVVQEPVADRIAPKEPMAAESSPRAEEIDAAAIATLVRAWAAAWSKQRADDYLAFYSDDYSPSGMKRSEWVSQRKRRITGPQFIEVGVESIAVRPAGDDRVQVRFLQSYRSDSYQDAVTKVLDLVRMGKDWKIARETSSDL